MTDDFEVYRSAGRVVFRKAVNDGNYGTEAAEVLVDVDLDGMAENDSEQAIAAALATARRIVHGELSQSPSAAVRRALEYPKPTPIGVAPNGEDSQEDLPF